MDCAEGEGEPTHNRIMYVAGRNRNDWGKRQSSTQLHVQALLLIENSCQGSPV